MKEGIIRIVLTLGLASAAGLFFLPESTAEGFFLETQAGEQPVSQKDAVRDGAPQKEQKPKRKINNPLFAEYKRRAQTLGIDMDFTGVVRSLVPYDARLNKDTLELELFCEKEKSLDVLLIGDSTMAWGVIPSVVEQRSGLKTGMFAMRSMYLNVRTMRTVKRLQKYYLKEGGITVFGFAIWTQLQEPEIVRRGELYAFSEYTDEEFTRFVTARQAACGGGLRREPEKPPEPAMYSRASLEAHTRDLHSIRAELREHFGSLRESVISRQVREWMHPAWFNVRAPAAQAAEPVNREQPEHADPDSNRYGDYREKVSLDSFQFIRWDNQTLTATGPFSLRSIPSRASHDPDFNITANHRTNANALLALPGPKAFVITIYPEHHSYIVQRSIYNLLYKDSLDLVDLGLLHPQKAAYPMDNEGHPANTGGLEKSILIADWLRNRRSVQ